MSSRLASLLVQDGRVDAQRMAEAIQRQVIYGGTLDTILLEMSLLDEEVADEYVARAAELPAAGALPDEARLLAPLFPQAAVEKLQAAPLGRDGGRPLLLVAEPTDPERLASLREAAGGEVALRAGTELQLMRLIERVYGVAPPPRFASLSHKLQKRAEGRPKPPPREVRSIDAEPEDDEERAARPQSVPPSPSEIEVLLPVDEPPRPARRAADAAPVAPAAEALTAPQRPSALDTPLPSLAQSPATAAPATPVEHDAGLKELHAAEDRDRIFEVLCRMARRRFSFAAVFLVQGETAIARIALGEGWVSSDVLANAKVGLGEPSSFRAAINGRAPYLGRVDDDSASAQAMAALGRPEKLWAALLPVVIRDRTIALLHVDDGGKRHDPAQVAELIIAAAEASQAFLRIILRAKAEKLGKSGPSSVGDGEAMRAGAASQQRAPALRKEVSALPDEETKPGLRRAVLDPLIEKQVEELLARLVRGEGGAIERLLAIGDDAARALTDRLPGPLKRGGRLEAGPGRSLDEQAPLVGAAVRFGASIVPHLLERLTDPAADVRQAVALVLGELRAPAAAPALGARLADDDETVRAAAAAGLARLAPSPELKQVLEALRGDLVATDARLQRRAAEALAVLRDGPAVPRLVELLKHREEQVSAVAHRALVEITKQDFGTSRWRWRSWWDRSRTQARTEWLLAGLDHKEPSVRRSAADELAALSTDYFGFHADLPARDRESAKKKFAAWSQSQRA